MSPLAWVYSRLRGRLEVLIGVWLGLALGLAIEDAVGRWVLVGLVVPAIVGAVGIFNCSLVMDYGELQAELRQRTRRLWWRLGLALVAACLVAVAAHAWPLPFVPTAVVLGLATLLVPVPSSLVTPLEAWVARVPDDGEVVARARPGVYLVGALVAGLLGAVFGATEESSLRLLVIIFGFILFALPVLMAGAGSVGRRRWLSLAALALLGLVNLIMAVLLIVIDVPPLPSQDFPATPRPQFWVYAYHALVHVVGEVPVALGHILFGLFLLVTSLYSPWRQLLLSWSPFQSLNRQEPGDRP